MHTAEVNMIWLESPTGVGFSYARLNTTANTGGGDTRTGATSSLLKILHLVVDFDRIN